ncbi:amino acid permease [Coprinellus micaceus]|uniref:Amino acid permease n=1 Tax=Coprinellus micaceus TaxID=71717 RepID=A0A4Y7TJW6_COPMI|nr:amino acid permease [Coprinellus micaceus]
MAPKGCFSTERKDPPRCDDHTLHVRDDWIAIEPPGAGTSTGEMRRENGDLVPPPTFRDSQQGIILRRQRHRPADNSGLKEYTGIPSRFINLPNAFEFAGWGSTHHLKLSLADRTAAGAALAKRRSEKILGQFTAAALAGNAVLGSVFYAFPAVIVVAGVYSPICLFIATLILFLWRPIMVELASALPISGAPYTYLLNVSTKTLAVVGSSMLVLDFAATSIVSSATAAEYLAGEVSLPFPAWVLAAMVLVLFTIVSLCGVRESARIALTVLSAHVLTMTSLIIASAVHWGRTGNDQLKANWHQGTSEHSSSPASIIKQVYFGVCLGMLGLTGFECTPSYISRIKDGRFPAVFRNLHYPAIIFNTLLMILVIATIPLDIIRGGANVLSVLGEMVAGKWLRIWVVCDAFIVLCGGVLTGILSACELLEQLSRHRVLPSFFLKLTSHTKAPYVSVFTFAAFCALIYATTGANLGVVSEMFSLVWLSVMALFPLSLLLLRFNRGRLRRETSARLSTVLFSLFVISPVILAGNVAINPKTAGYFAIYVLGVLSVLVVTQNKVAALRHIYWVYDQWHSGRRRRGEEGTGRSDGPDSSARKTSGKVGGKFVKLMTKMRRQVVCVCVKGDEINLLFHMILYVQRNEETSHLKIVHFYEEEKDGVPSELESNAKILDEAFPEITIDLVLIEGTFDPQSVHALAHHLDIPTSLMFMSCPGPGFPWSVADLGTRVILL